MNLILNTSPVETPVKPAPKSPPSAPPTVPAPEPRDRPLPAFNPYPFPCKGELEGVCFGDYNIR